MPRRSTITCRSERGGRQSRGRLSALALAAGLGVSLGACTILADGTEGASFAAEPRGFTLPSFNFSLFGGQRRETALAGGAVTLTAPEGWCIEPRSLQSAAEESFALLARCEALSRGQRAEGDPLGYATLVIGPRLGEDVSGATLLDGLVSADARTAAGGGLTYGRVPRTRSDETSRPTWRGAVALEGWPVLLTLHEPVDSNAALNGPDLLRALADGLEAAPRPAPAS